MGEPPGVGPGLQDHSGNELRANFVTLLQAPLIFQFTPISPTTVQVPPVSQALLGRGRCRGLFPYLLPSPEIQPLSLLPGGPHSSFPIRGQKFPFFLSFLFCSEDHSQMTGSNALTRHISNYHSRGRRGTARISTPAQGGTLLDTAGCSQARLPCCVCRLPRATSRLSTGPRTRQGARTEPVSSKRVSTGIVRVTEMHIHRTAGANRNTPGKQVGNSLHACIHSFSRS